ncbi:FAD/NAD(P)-binding domain-containing protein [Coprinellus micaceus]|uniref:FAD/NAD(P)-binding domain-containing protein n=1 Tax=Coprinellus micaceus TaxID=71717 RepID=A0A4Y7SXY6_COPMI|nr:FAD/NAD(P)-binding domain-containing protein [Coprinellus micaceus]
MAASALAREGISTVVLEAIQLLVRYHIGESMLPSLTSFMQFIGMEKKLREHGFCIKRGAAVKFNQRKREGYTDFIKDDVNNGSWNVVRSEFDELLLRHAGECGATVLEEHKVIEVHFEGSEVDRQDTRRPYAVTYARPSGETGRIEFDYLVDASGRNGILSTKYLKNRKMNDSLKNVACWGYWEGGYGIYMPGTRRENAPWFEALTDESGWGWFIPLHNGTVSVGIVLNQDISNAKKAAGRDASVNGSYSLRDHYLAQFQYLPGLKKLLGTATLAGGIVKSASDYSYSADGYAGNHFRIIGDASAFIDPLFSSGVHLALLGGLTAAATIAASIRGHCPESVAADYHSTKVGAAYTRFFFVVMSAYKQIRSQTIDVLSDVDEDNFDRAFDIIRPVIQGSSDVGKKVTEDELQKALDFCQDVWAPTDPEMHAAVAARLGPELLSPSAPIYSKEELDRLVDPLDEDALDVVRRINARKVTDRLFRGTYTLEAEAEGGYVTCLQRGRLGLMYIGDD